MLQRPYKCSNQLKLIKIRIKKWDFAWNPLLIKAKYQVLVQNFLNWCFWKIINSKSRKKWNFIKFIQVFETKNNKITIIKLK